jgi:hypothetical protein
MTLRRVRVTTVATEELQVKKEKIMSVCVGILTPVTQHAMHMRHIVIFI